MIVPAEPRVCDCSMCDSLQLMSLNMCDCGMCDDLQLMPPSMCDCGMCDLTEQQQLNPKHFCRVARPEPLKLETSQKTRSVVKHPASWLLRAFTRVLAFSTP